MNISHRITMQNGIRLIITKAFVVVLTLIIFGILLSGCTPKPIFLRPDYNDRTSFKTVAVMPVVDSLAGTGSQVICHSLSKKLEDKLKDRNYDVLSADNVVSMLTANGVAENDIATLSPQNICRMLGVDGILTSSLTKYTNAFMIHHQLDMGLRLWNSKGDSIWIHRASGNEITAVNNVGYIVSGIIGAKSAQTSTGSGVGKSSGEISDGAAIGIGVGVGLLAGMLVEAFRNFDNETLSGYFKTLPDGQGRGDVMPAMPTKLR
jgi:hypothetical protein